MRVGVTGSSKNVTIQQEAGLLSILSSFTFSELHHGDCVGADALAHEIAVELRDKAERVNRPRVIVHPPDILAKRACCQGADEVREPKPYLVRDRGIVNEVDILIALPESSSEVLRSGTWATVRYARERKILIIRVNPDGSFAFG